MDFSFILQQLISGAAIGMAYALIAIGYSMVYGILRFINFGHGALYMVGAYIGYYVWTSLSGQVGTGRMGNAVGFVAATLVAMAGAAIFGVLMELVAYRPTRGRSRLTTFMSSVGMSLFVTYGMEFIAGPAPKPMPTLFRGVRFNVGGAVLTGMQILMLAVAVTLLVGLELFVRHSRIGRGIRACSEDMGAAYLMGVNVNQAVSVTFAIGSALGAIGGILVAMYYKAVYPTMGWIAGLKGFVCAVVGGIGSVPGAMVGGLLLGMGENLGAGFVASGYRDAIAFLVLIVVTLFWPTGIFAREQKSSL